MAVTTREQVMVALLKRIESIAGGQFATYGRKCILWPDLVALYQQNGAPLFPALYTYDGVGYGGGVNTWTQRGKGLPVVRSFSVTLVIYNRQGQSSPAAGASILTPLIELVELAFQPDDLSQNTLTLVSQLGQLGKVSHCWLEGDGHTIPGDIDPSGIAMQTIPVRIMLP